jgi:drug/metabolite transporter (DMT)-like permease
LFLRARDELTHNRDGRRLLAFAGLVLTTFFWATNAVIARGVADDIHPFALAFWRWVSALIVILPFGIPHIRRSGNAVRANTLQLGVLGLLSVGAYNTLLYLAARTTTSLNIALVNSTMPIVIAIVALIMLRERTTRTQLAGFAAAAAGMLLIIARGEWQVLSAFAFREGDMLMIAAVIVWGFYSVLLRYWRVQLHPVAFLTVTIAVGVVLLLPAYVWEFLATSSSSTRPRPLMLTALFVYLGIFPSILSFLFWNNAVAVVGPAVTGMFIYLVPVFTALLAVPILGESLHAYHALGGALILAGLFLSTRTRSAAVQSMSG